MATDPRRLTPLPIDPAVPEILARLEKGNSLVLQASPGSGKTTRVPPALLSAPFRRPDGRILVLEPRRLAAKYAARRVAEERGESVGNVVGYHFRLEKVAGPSTRLLFLTEGMLVRRLLGDPELSDVDVVVLDEFHERHLHTDVALATLKSLQARRRNPLRLIVMSATLDSDRIAAYLGDAPIVRVEARVFPIDVGYLPSPDDRPLDVLVKNGVRDVMLGPGADGGDCLVFLPGMGEIRRAESALQPLARERGWRLHALHGELSREEQDAAIAKGDRPKIVLATNVAETSLTIDGVTAVVDSGLHRQASYSWWSGVPSLKTRPVSRASATQRAGRAGRTAPGRCLRLYTKADFEGRPPFETPELQRADLAQLYLELKAMGVESPASLPWYDPPPESSFRAARELLERLGALEGEKVTPLGGRLAEIPAHPRVARLLVEAERRGALAGAATLAALLTDGRLESLDALDAVDDRRLDPGTRRSRDLLLRGFDHGDVRSGTREDLARCVLFAFPDRVARKRDWRSPGTRLPQGQAELVFASGGSARIADSGVVAESTTFVTLDVQEQKGIADARAQLRVRSLVPIQEEWLFDIERGGVEEKEVVWWDDQKERVAGASRLMYGQLVLEESPLDPGTSAEAARLLLTKGLGIAPEKAPALTATDWIEILGRLSDREAVEASLARVQLAARHVPELGLADPQVAPLYPHLIPALEGIKDKAGLRQVNWPEMLLDALAGPKRGELDRIAPSHVMLPGGRRVRVQYALDKAPWIESRLQDFFGMQTGPTVAKGRLPLTLHLLAPNQRAVQVTTDLAGFWQRAYPPLRKELSRKYPRHSWPEDPTTAKPPEPRRR